MSATTPALISLRGSNGWHLFKIAKSSADNGYIGWKPPGFPEDVADTYASKNQYDLEPGETILIVNDQDPRITYAYTVQPPSEKTLKLLP